MKNSVGSIKVVCFDLGGVVVRIDMQSSRRELSDGYQLGRIDCDGYYRLISESSGGLYEPHEVEAVHRAWVFEAYPGVDALIERLNTIDGLRTACLSNTNHSHWQDLLRTDGGRPAVPAIQLLDTKLVSHELDAVKPDERIYRLAEERFGASGSEIVFFDDLIENVEGAQRCGWIAEQVDHSGDPASQIRSHLERLGVL